MRKNREIIINIILYALLIVISIVFLIPLIWGISGSFRPRDEIFKYSNPISLKTFIPINFTLSAYKKIFTAKIPVFYPRALFNSFFIGVITVILGLIINSMAGFAFAKYNFKGKSFLFALIVFSFMIPFEVIAIPLYVLVKSWNLIDTYFALILPAIANGLAVFLFNQFFKEIPTSLFDAARIDGASIITVLTKIVFPLSKPVVICVSLLLFLGQWDSLFWPLIAITKNEMVVIQVAVSRWWGQYGVEWDQILAGSMFAAGIPVLIFLFFQKYYVQGIAGTGIK